MKKILKIGALVLLMGSIVLILSTEKVFANFPMISVPLFKENEDTYASGDSNSLVNKGTEPFYIVRERTGNSNESQVLNQEVPDKYELLYKLDAKNVWDCRYGGICSSWGYGRFPLYIAPKIPEFEMPYGDSMPTVEQIPKPENFTILAFYKGVPVEIKGTRYFRLYDEKYYDLTGKMS